MPKLNIPVLLDSPPLAFAVLSTLMTKSLLVPTHYDPAAFIFGCSVIINETQNVETLIS